MAAAEWIRKWASLSIFLVASTGKYFAMVQQRHTPKKYMISP